MALRVLIDTNVLLDYLICRAPFDQEAKEIVSACSSGTLSMRKCQMTFPRECQEKPKKLDALVSHFSDIFSRLNRDCKAEKISTDAARSIVELTEKVVESLARKESRVVERIGDLMGGQSISYPTKVIREDEREKTTKRVTKKERALGIQAVIRTGKRLNGTMEACARDIAATYGISPE